MENKAFPWKLNQYSYVCFITNLQKTLKVNTGTEHCYLNKKNLEAEGNLPSLTSAFSTSLNEGSLFKSPYPAKAGLEAKSLSDILLMSLIVTAST